MEKLLSIIIPTYNMSLYIERCMNSLISSKTIEKLDIIVVNDGSKDDSSEKAKNIAISYPNSIRVIDKEMGIMVLVSILVSNLPKANTSKF